MQVAILRKPNRGVFFPRYFMPAPNEFRSSEMPTAPSFCTAIAKAVEAFRAEIEELYAVAPEAELSDGGRLLRQSLVELHLQCRVSTGDERLACAHSSGAAGSGGKADLRQGRQAWETPTPSTRRLASSYADASVGTDDIVAPPARGRAASLARSLTVQQLLGALDRGMTIELSSSHKTRPFDVQRDVASLVFGRSATALAIRLRWLCVAIIGLGAAVPVFLIFTVHWASGGMGQFALAYAWPFWLEVWICVGYWLSFGVVLLWYASMQLGIAWMALRQFSTMWVISMSGVWITALASIYEFGVQRSTWVGLPVYIMLLVFFPLVAMADALPPKLRLTFLRFGALFGLAGTAIVTLGLRLPTAEGTPGELLWTGMGIDTVTNLQALTYSSTVMVVLLSKGVLRAWVYPDRLAFVQTSLYIAESAAGARSGGLHAPSVDVPGASASIAPHPLELRSLH